MWPGTNSDRRRKSWRVDFYLGIGAVALYVVAPANIALVLGAVACGVVSSFVPVEPRHLFGSRGGDLLRALLLVGPVVAASQMDLGWVGSGQVVLLQLFGASLRRQPKQDSLEGRLQVAIEGGDTARAKFLIDEGADITSRIVGETALGWAVLQGNVELVRYLLERGADVHQRTSEGDLIGNAALGKGEAGTIDEKQKYDELIAFLRGEISSRQS